MREILFRGKGYNSDEWIYGYYFIDAYGQAEILDGSRGTAMDPDTVGQYTGLEDRNGEEIFEGDIIRYIDGDKAAVIWDEPKARFSTKIKLSSEFGLYFDSEIAANSEIIGNIYDNPELMEDKEDERE